jgi:hypothetical protein
MSSPYMTRANEIATRLRQLGALEGVGVIVDRQKDLSSEVDKFLNNAKGAMVAILWTGGKLVDGSPLVMDASFEVHIFGRPVIRGSETPADEMVAAILPALHDWQADTAGHCDWDFKVSGDLRIAPDKNFICYFFPVTGRVRLIQPTLL